MAVSVLATRKRHCERGAIARAARDRYGPPVGLDQAFDNGQAQASAAGHPVSARVGSVELVKYAGEVVDGYSRARVRDRHHHAVGRA